jgi:dihydrofolate reductase
MAGAWPERAGDPFADRMNTIPKYVASRTLSQDDLGWPGSTLLPADDALGAVRGLRARDGRGLQVMGSPTFAAQLVEQDLVDEYRLMIEPILLGGGKQLFPADRKARPLELVSVTPGRDRRADLHLPAGSLLTCRVPARAAQLSDRCVALHPMRASSSARWPCATQSTCGWCPAAASPAVRAATCRCWATTPSTSSSTRPGDRGQP